ncbi:hypothetical protein OROMI_031475 [Orobanche minor]
MDILYDGCHQREELELMLTVLFRQDRLELSLTKRAVWIHGACKFYIGLGDLLVIELIAIRDSLRLSTRLGLTSFAILSDC